MEDYIYTVWVGGIEVNDCYLTHKQAQVLANRYKRKGYHDVEIEQVFERLKVEQH